MKIIARILLFCACSLASTSSLARFTLPNQLNQNNRREALEILAPATSSRMLSSPYPLGGWDGFEVGVSRHYVPVSYLQDLGHQPSDNSDFEYPLLTLGKGLYYNLDLFLSIVPMAQSDTINHFSTQIRYQFWESEGQIFRLSGLINGGTTTLNNQLNIQSYGFDLLGTTTIDQVSLYLGLGTSTANGRFIGGVTGLTESQQTESEKITLGHQLIGLEWPIANFFWAAEVDRFKIPYYSLKIGYRL